MEKIIKITEKDIYIGNEQGKIIKVKKEDIDWEAKVGDKVKIYSSDIELVVTKLEEEKSSSKRNDDEQQKMASNNKDGINIVINNQSNNKNESMYNGETAGVSVVNKVVYVLLAIFFGGLGLHKFYAGKASQGVIYLLLCWTFIPAIIGFIEGIMAAFKPSDSNGNIVL